MCDSPSVVKSTITGSITQEPVASQPLDEIAADNQVENGIKIQEEVSPQEPTSSQLATKISMREPQKKTLLHKNQGLQEWWTLLLKRVQKRLLSHKKQQPQN